MLIKTYALSVTYGTPFDVLVWRVPIYIVTAFAEAVILIVLYKSKVIRRGIERVKNNELQ